MATKRRSSNHCQLPAKTGIAARGRAGDYDSGHILETRNLTKEFKGFTAVSDVNLRVRRGSIHALIGPNGAGKTTCFNLLTKFLEPTTGTILFNGIDITRERPRRSRAAA
jgi:ABC-type branched-subunit amino acid transport system ATPase component